MATLTPKVIEYTLTVSEAERRLLAIMLLRTPYALGGDLGLSMQQMVELSNAVAMERDRDTPESARLAVAYVPAPTPTNKDQ